MNAMMRALRGGSAQRLLTTSKTQAVKTQASLHFTYHLDPKLRFTFFQNLFWSQQQLVSERLPGADCHQQQGPAWRRIITLVHESMFRIHLKLPGRGLWGDCGARVERDKNIAWKRHFSDLESSLGNISSL